MTVIMDIGTISSTQ